MKQKLLTLTTLLLCAVASAWAEDITIIPITGSYNYTSLAKVTLDDSNLKVSSGQIQTTAKSTTGSFTISTNAPGVYLKSASFTDANSGKLGSFTCTSGGSLSSSSPYTFTASSNVTSATFSVTANSSGSAKLGTISIVVTSSENNIETLSSFSLTSGTYSFTTQKNGTSATPTVSLTTPTSSGGSVNSGNISLSSGRTITFTSENNIKYIAFYDTNCRASFSVTSGGGTCDGATWTAGSNTKTVTLQNSAGTTLSGLSKVYVITEAETPTLDGTWTPTSGSIYVDDAVPSPSFGVTASNGDVLSGSEYNVTYSVKAGSTDGMIEITSGGTSFTLNNNVVGTATLVATLTSTDTNAYEV